MISEFKSQPDPQLNTRTDNDNDFPSDPRDFRWKRELYEGKVGVKAEGSIDVSSDDDFGGLDYRRVASRGGKIMEKVY